MVKYNSDRQLTIEEFKTPFQTSLLADNRWVKLSKVVPWDKFASVYMSMMTVDFGRPGISPRIVLGALIIKHLEKLDDRGVIAAIQENPYMQFFIGLKEFTTPVSYTHLRAHETPEHLVCRLLLEKKKKTKNSQTQMPKYKQTIKKTKNITPVITK